MNLVGRDVEQFRQRADMGMVLTQGVLKAMLLFEIHLRPVSAFGVGEYPALVVFRLDHEYSEDGNNHMVDLRRSLFGRNRDVFDQVIDVRIKEKGPVRLNRYSRKSRERGRGYLNMKRVRF